MKRSETSLCSIAQLNYNSLPPEQDVVDEFTYVEYPSLTNGLSDSNIPLEFRIDKTDMYVDLAGIYLSYSVHVYKADGSKLVEGEEVSVINNLGYSLFSGIDVFIQDKKISNSQGCYPFASYVKMLMFTTKNEKKYFLRQALWRRDEAGLFDDTGLDPEKGANTGLVDRAAYIQMSMEVNLFVKLLFDFTITNLLPAQSEVFLRLHRSPTLMCIMAKEGEYKIQISKAKIYVPKYRLNEHGKRMVTSAFHRGLTSPATRFVTYTRMVGKNDQNFDWVPITGIMPKRIFYFQLLNSAYNGTINKNIFNFQFFNLKKIQVSKNGTNIPTSQGITVGSSSPELLYTLTMNALNTPENTYFNEWEFQNGYMVACFDLTQNAGAASTNYTNPMENGTVRIQVDYDKPLEEAATVFCLAEYDAKLHFDSNGNPEWL